MIVSSTISSYTVIALFINAIILFLLLYIQIFNQPFVGFGYKMNHIRSAIFFCAFFSLFFPLLAKIEMQRTELYVVLIPVVFVCRMVVVYRWKEQRSKINSFPKFDIETLLRRYTTKDRLTVCSCNIEKVECAEVKMFVCSFFYTDCNSEIRKNFFKTKRRSFEISQNFWTKIEGLSSLVRKEANTELMKMLLKANNILLLYLW